MATTTDDIANTYPIPVYRYRVSVGMDEMSFSSVSGLDMQYDTISYRDGVGGFFQMPGLMQPLNITFTRGIVSGQSQLYDWISSISYNQVEKKDISVSLTNDTGDQLFVTWNIYNAFPSSLSAPSFDANSNDVAVESLQLVADRIAVEFH